MGIKTGMAKLKKNKSQIKNLVDKVFLFLVTTHKIIQLKSCRIY